MAALASFDSYYDLLILLDPNPLEEKFIKLNIFPDEEQHLCSDEDAACCSKIEALLKKARSIIVNKGATLFIEMVKILSQMKTYKELAYHLIGKCSNFLSTHSALWYIRMYIPMYIINFFVYDLQLSFDTYTSGYAVSYIS